MQQMKDQLIDIDITINVADHSCSCRCTPWSCCHCGPPWQGHCTKHCAHCVVEDVHPGGGVGGLCSAILIILPLFNLTKSLNCQLIHQFSKGRKSVHLLWASCCWPPSSMTPGPRPPPPPPSVPGPSPCLGSGCPWPLDTDPWSRGGGAPPSPRTTLRPPLWCPALPPPTSFLLADPSFFVEFYQCKLCDCETCSITLYSYLFQINILYLFQIV